MNPGPDTPRTGREQLTATWKWITRRRRTALTQVLRGACYGAGTGAAGLIFLWAEHWL
ncbi:hypothetical protein ACIQI8_42055 [Streptomyces sp. NPDC092369]|uniref:hypothetical protein n=1 Tax=Streptomyces sp. NPDC092369 TaxID=3366015 RepID=UPI00381816B8